METYNIKTMILTKLITSNNDSPFKIIPTKKDEKKIKVNKNFPIPIFGFTLYNKKIIKKNAITCRINLASKRFKKPNVPKE